MPDRGFLEMYPLYRKFRTDLPALRSELPRPAITVSCPICESPQTFTMENVWGQESLDYAGTTWARTPVLFRGQTESPDLPGFVGKAIYRCSSCQRHVKTFLLRFDDALLWVMKVGEYPPWSVDLSNTMVRFLGGDAVLFKSGLICESQGYGIGAFAYYRRVVDIATQKLLAGMLDLLAGDEKAALAELVKEAETRKTATEKLELVKSAIPAILCPDGANPVAMLYDVLSDGLHNLADEQCLEGAVQIREVLTFLIETVEQLGSARSSYSESLRSLKKKQD